MTPTAAGAAPESTERWPWSPPASGPGC